MKYLVKHKPSGIVIKGNSVYLLGGEDEDKRRDEVQCFDLKTVLVNGMKYQLSQVGSAKV